MFDTTRVYLVGQSHGGCAASYAAICLRHRHGDDFVSSWATVWSGLWEFPSGGGGSSGGSGGGSGSGRGYYPIVPVHAKGLKACIFDGDADTTLKPDGAKGIAVEPIDFYSSSLRLEREWKSKGNQVRRVFILSLTTSKPILISIVN